MCLAAADGHVVHVHQMWSCHREEDSHHQQAAERDGGLGAELDRREADHRTTSNPVREGSTWWRPPPRARPM